MPLSAESSWSAAAGVDRSLLPAAFVSRLVTLLGDAEATRVIGHLRTPSRLGLRVNPLRIANLDEPQPNVSDPVIATGLAIKVAAHVAEVLATLPVPVARIAGLEHAYVAPASARALLTASAPLINGAVWLQNPSSLLPVLALDPQPGEEVLDLAAAPGMKALHIAARMRNAGRIAVVEAVKPRFFKMRDLLQRGGATNTHAYLADGRGIGRKTPARFDRVLLDAPCSSEARFQQDVPRSMSHWSERKVRDCARKQRGLLWSAFTALKPGGRLVYSTCAFAPEENEGSIAWLLTRAGGAAQLVPWRAPAGELRAGMTRWRNDVWPAELAHCTRVLPDGLFGGFFVAIVEKSGRR